MDIKIHPQKSIFTYPTNISLYCKVFKFVTLLRTRRAKDRPAPAFHEGFITTVATLMTFLQLKYQACDGNPFSTHPITMGIAVWATVVYFFATSGQINFPADRWRSAAAMSRHCAVLCGNVVIASLSSLFVADSVRPVVYGVAVLVSGRELLRWLCGAIFKRRRRSDCEENVSEV